MKKFYKSNISKIGLTALVIAGLLVGCKKDTTRPTLDVDTKAAQDNSKGQYVFNKVNHIVDDAARSQGGVNKTDITPCMSVKLDITNDPNTNYFPKTLTCTFDSTCKAPNGDVRKGTIRIVLTKHISDSLATITTTFDGFYLNGYKVEGTLTERNIGRAVGFNLSAFSFNLPDGKITSSSGDVTTLNFTQTKQLLNGAGTSAVVGDAYQLTGSSSGTSAGSSFTAAITKPLMFDASVCQYLTSGVLEVRPSGKDLSTVDFGTGACTGTANVTNNKTTITVNQSGK